MRTLWATAQALTLKHLVQPQGEASRSIGGRPRPPATAAASSLRFISSAASSWCTRTTATGACHMVQAGPV